MRGRIASPENVPEFWRTTWGDFGSGRRGYSSAPTCEATHSIDLAWLRRRRMLEPGRIGPGRHEDPHRRARAIQPADAISDAGNAMVSCRPLRVSRHTSEPSTGPIALGSVWVVAGVPSTAKASRRNRRACAGGPIGASNGNMRSCRVDGWRVSRRERRSYSSALRRGHKR
jgi:hypothetical protein